MSLEDRVAVLEYRLKELEAKVSSSPAAPASNGAGPARGTIASDYDLDGPYGDPIVKKDPKRWAGESFAGCKMSECSAEFLDECASLYDWMGDQDDAQGKTWQNKNKPDSKPIAASTFKRKDAALARGWASRIRSGRGKADTRYSTSGHGASPKHTGTPESADGFDYGSDVGSGSDEIPFISSATVAPRHHRRRRLWERF